MKKIKCVYFLLLVFIQTNLLAQIPLSDSNNEFAFTIYKSTKVDTTNFLISPFSINMALSMAKEGANTTTLAEINQLLNQENTISGADQFNQYIANITDNNNLQLANSIWLNDDFKINKEFKSSIDNSCHSQLFTFNSDNLLTANNDLNKWISESTNHKINTVAGLNENVKMSIINAVYFLGEWQNPFNNKLTKEKKFFSITKKNNQKDFMNKKTTLNYYEDSTLKCVVLPYTNQFSMLVFLPLKKYGIVAMEDLLSPKYVKKIEQNSSKLETELSLPKFKIETEIQLIQKIKELGYSEMFSDRADFSKISTAEKLQIGNIIHKTFIEVDEKKTEAAALTQTIMIGYATLRKTPIPPPKIFNANHPFVFLIKDNRTNSILFMGRIVN